MSFTRADNEWIPIQCPEHFHVFWSFDSKQQILIRNIVGADGYIGNGWFYREKYVWKIDIPLSEEMRNWLAKQEIAGLEIAKFVFMGIGKHQSPRLKCDLHIETNFNINLTILEKNPPKSLDVLLTSNRPELQPELTTIRNDPYNLMSGTTMLPLLARKLRGVLLELARYGKPMRLVGEQLYRFIYEDISLDKAKDWGIDLQSLQQAYPASQIHTSPEPPPPETNTRIKIDYARINSLHLESNEVRERLIVDDEQDTPIIESASAMIIEPTPPLSPEPQATSFALNLERPDDTPDHLLTDLHEVAEVLGQDETIIKLLRYLHSQGWEGQARNARAILQGEFLNVVLDRLNECSLDVLGDEIIFAEGDMLVVAEDYRDELEHILAHIEDTLVSRSTDRQVSHSPNPPQANLADIENARKAEFEQKLASIESEIQFAEAKVREWSKKVQELLESRDALYEAYGDKFRHQSQQRVKVPRHL